MRSINFSSLRRFFLLTVCLVGLALIVGCLKAGVGDPEQAKVDDKLVGIWQPANPDEKSILVINKFDPRAYVITAFDFDKDHNVYKPAEGVYKAWLAKIGDTQFITMQIMGADALSHDPAYIVAKLSIDGDKVTARSVDFDFAKDATTTDALTKLLSDNLNNDKAFEHDSHVYNRLTVDEFHKLVEGEQAK